MCPENQEENRLRQIGSPRVSTGDQNPTAHLAALKREGDKKIGAGKASGACNKQAELGKCVNRRTASDRESGRFGNVPTITAKARRQKQYIQTGNGDFALRLVKRLFQEGSSSHASNGN